LAKCIPVLREMDVKGPLVAFEMVIDNIPEPKQSATARPALEALDLLPVKRDFAFVADANGGGGQVHPRSQGRRQGADQ
jgi:phenylalanyl-tRNA synthetase beta subunit